MSEKQTVTLLTQANKALVKTIGEVAKVTANLESMGEKSTAMASEIALKQSEMDALGEKMADEFRRAEAELNLKVLENERRVLLTLLKKLGLAEISEEDLRQLRVELETAKEDNSEAIEKAVKMAESKLHAEYGGKLKTVEADHKVNMAEKDATNKSLEMQIGFMTESIDGYKATIESERDARVKIAASEAQKSGVVVNTSGK